MVLPKEREPLAYQAGNIDSTRLAASTRAQNTAVRVRMTQEISRGHQSHSREMREDHPQGQRPHKQREPSVYISRTQQSITQDLLRTILPPDRHPSSWDPINNLKATTLLVRNARGSLMEAGPFQQNGKRMPLCQAGHRAWAKRGSCWAGEYQPSRPRHLSSVPVAHRASDAEKCF